MELCHLDTTLFGKYNLLLQMFRFYEAVLNYSLIRLFMLKGMGALALRNTTDNGQTRFVEVVPL